MDAKELRALCLDFENVLEFQMPRDLDSIFFKHGESGKWYAFLFFLKDRLCLNVKVDPMDSSMLCELYKGITPGWHMNKRHWITIDVNSDVPLKEIKYHLSQSYAMTKGKHLHD